MERSRGVARLLVVTAFVICSCLALPIPLSAQTQDSTSSCLSSSLGLGPAIVGGQFAMRAAGTFSLINAGRDIGLRLDFSQASTADRPLYTKALFTYDSDFNDEKSYFAITAGGLFHKDQKVDNLAEQPGKDNHYQVDQLVAGGIVRHLLSEFSLPDLDILKVKLEGLIHATYFYVDGQQVGTLRQTIDDQQAQRYLVYDKSYGLAGGSVSTLSLGFGLRFPIGLVDFYAGTLRAERHAFLDQPGDTSFELLYGARASLSDLLGGKASLGLELAGGDQIAYASYSHPLAGPLSANMGFGHANSGEEIVWLSLDYSFGSPCPSRVAAGPVPGTDAEHLRQELANVVAMIRVLDTTPDPVNFATPAAVPPNSRVENSFTVSGLDPDVNVPVSVNGGRHSINEGAWSSGRAWVKNGDRVRIEFDAPGGYGQTSSGQVIVGNQVFSTVQVTTTPPPTVNSTGEPGSERTPTPRFGGIFFITEPRW